MSERDLRNAACHFFGKGHSLSVLGGSSGFSGSSFAKVCTRGMHWCLRRWPIDFEKSRLSFIHRVLLHSQNQGFTGVPALATTTSGETVLDLNGMLFDAQEWIMGESLAGRSSFGERMPNVVVSLEPGILLNLADVLGKFHRSAKSLKPENEDEKKTLRTRIDDFKRCSEVEHDIVAAGVEESAEGKEHDVARRWLELLPSALSSAEMLTKEYGTVAQGTTLICHGDLWASHIYFAGDEFVGFTDFQSLYRGSPVSDLAQLILHFGGWKARDIVLAAYDKVLPLEEEDLATLPVAAVADLAFEGYWALSSLYRGSSSLIHREKAAHETNLSTLLDSLELVVRELQ